MLVTLLGAWSLAGAALLQVGFFPPPAAHGWSGSVATSAQVVGAQVVGTGVVGADNKDERDRLAQAQKQSQQAQQQLEASLEGIDASLAKLYVDLRQTESQIPVAQAALSAAQAKQAEAERNHQTLVDRLQVARSQSEQVAAQIEAGQAQIEASRNEIAQIALRAFRGEAQNTSPLQVFLQSSSTADISKRLELAEIASRAQDQILQSAQQLTAENRARQARQQAIAKRIGELEAQAQVAVENARQARQESAQQLKNVQDLQVKQKNLSTQLESQKDTVETQIAEQKQLQAQAAARIAQIDEENRRKAQNRTVGGGIFGPPLSGGLSVTSGFGSRVHPVLGYRLMHTGTDFAAGCGTPILAAQSGTVTSAAWDGSGGNSVYINHGLINGVSWTTVYRHLSAYRVSAGQSIKQGQTLGLVGSTGRSTGCHLHFEIWKNGALIDPMGMY